MTKEQLLGEIVDILRATPTQEAVTKHQPETIPWISRASAALERWDRSRSASVLVAQIHLRALSLPENIEGYLTINMLLHQAHADLQMESGQTSVVLESGQVFHYFDAMRKLLEMAHVEVLFVDRYLDAEFVSRYLPLVADGTGIRLLGRQRMATLLPAVDLFQQQYKRAVEVRSSEAIHDRYVFLDRAECYASSASFKDGARNSSALIVKVSDAFQATWNIYEQHWAAGKVHRP